MAIVDVRMPPTHTTEGLEAARQIRQTQPEVAILVLSQYIETRYAIDLIREDPAGIGYLLKERVTRLDDLADAVRRVAAGGSVIDPEVVARLLGRPRSHSPLDELTPREREILALMAEGRSNAAIAQRLTLELKTVEGHVRAVFSKLGLEPAGEDHRRVLAVLAWLAGRRTDCLLGSPQTATRSSACHALRWSRRSWRVAGLRLLAGWLLRRCPMVKQRASTSGQRAQRPRCRRC